MGEEQYKFLSGDTDKETNYSVGLSQGFNSANKFSQAEIRELNQVFYKGASEKFLAVTKKGLYADGNIVELSSNAVNAKINEYASRAISVLAFWYLNSPFRKDTIRSVCENSKWQANY